MGSSSVVVAEVAVGMAINGVYSVQHDNNPFPTFVAGGIMLGGLLFLSEFGPDGIATALAGLYLLASFLYHGGTFINVLTNITNAKATNVPRPAPTTIREA